MKMLYLSSAGSDKLCSTRSCSLIYEFVKGEPDDYSCKAFALLLLPFVNVIIYFILFFIPRIDPRKKNYAFFGSSYQNIRLLIHLFFAGVFVFITQTTSGGQPLKLNAFLSLMLIFF